MSDLIIRDGTGSGQRAKVTSDNRLGTRSLTQTDSAAASFERQDAYSLSILDIAPPAVECPVLRFKNVDPVRLFRLNRLHIGWNGGNTNHNRCVRCRMYVGMYPPTANYTTSAAGNLFISSRNTALMEVQKWDGVGNGMTVAANGVKFIASAVAAGLLIIPVDGTIIMSYNDIIGVTAEPEEVGLMSVVISGWYETPED